VGFDSSVPSMTNVKGPKFGKRVSNNHQKDILVGWKIGVPRGSSRTWVAYTGGGKF